MDSVKNFFTVATVIGVIVFLIVGFVKYIELVELNEEKETNKKDYFKKLEARYSSFNEDELYRIFCVVEYLYRCKKIGYYKLDEKSKNQAFELEFELDNWIRRAEIKDGVQMYGYGTSTHIEYDYEYLKNDERLKRFIVYK